MAVKLVYVCVCAYVLKDKRSRTRIAVNGTHLCDILKSPLFTQLTLNNSQLFSENYGQSNTSVTKQTQEC